jgi:hypothetical protein
VPLGSWTATTVAPGRPSPVGGVDDAPFDGGRGHALRRGRRRERDERDGRGREE